MGIDRAPTQLRKLLGVPSNLLAHHIRVLEDAGLLTRTRSEGDRRRSYLRLQVAAFDRAFDELADRIDNVAPI